MSKNLVKSTATWIYNPENLFEKPFFLSCRGYELHFENGIVIATFTQPKEQISRVEIAEIEEKIRSIIQIQAIGGFEKQPVTLTEKEICNYFSDGAKSISYNASMGIGLGMECEFTHTDKDGNVIYDSRLEREQKGCEFRGKSLKHPNDYLLRKLTDIYNAANHDPENVFVHLYEIRDALVAFFNPEDAAQTKQKKKKSWGKNAVVMKELGISKDDWQSFGDITNDGKLKQSRHRGLHLGKHRRATPEELNSIRSLAYQMIDKYLDYLDNQQVATP